MATSVNWSDICCKADPKNKNTPIKKEYLKNSLLSFTNSYFIFFFSKYKKKGNKTKNPTKNLTPLNKYGPINSIPVSWAINVVPHIKVHPSALKIEIDLDIQNRTYNYMANLKAKFLPKLSLITLQNLAASAPSIILWS